LLWIRIWQQHESGSDSSKRLYPDLVAVKSGSEILKKNVKSKMKINEGVTLPEEREGTWDGGESPCRHPGGEIWPPPLSGSIPPWAALAPQHPAASP